MAEVPTDDVLKMREEKKSDDEIKDKLFQQGFKPAEIMEALGHADIKGGIEGKLPSEDVGHEEEGMQESVLSPDEIPVPSPAGAETKEPKPKEEAQPETSPPVQDIMPGQEMPSVQSPMGIRETVHEIVESVVDERWQQVMNVIGDLNEWKRRVEEEIKAIKQEILRNEARQDNLQHAIIGKVEEYNKTLSNVNTEILALEKVFEKIMEPLTTNIKELGRVTEELKKGSSPK